MYLFFSIICNSLVCCASAAGCVLQRNHQRHHLVPDREDPVAGRGTTTGQPPLCVFQRWPHLYRRYDVLFFFSNKPFHCDYNFFFFINVKSYPKHMKQWLSVSVSVSRPSASPWDCSCGFWTGSDHLWNLQFPHLQVSALRPSPFSLLLLAWPSKHVCF